MDGLTIGARVRIIEMPNDPNPVPRGTEGTINYIGKFPGPGQQIGVAWDNGSTLMLIVGEDEFELV